MGNDSNQTNSNSDQNRAGGQETQTVVERPPLREPVRQRPAPVHMAEQPVEVRRVREEKNRNVGEYVKFGILAVILLGTPVVISLLIPLIFGQIVPSVLGSNQPTETPALPGDQVVQPESGETPAGNDLSTDPEVGIGGESTEVLVTPPAPETTPSDVLVHIVRTGETLDVIARQYGLTAADLAEANNLQNPNQIFSGQVLIIPQPSSP